MPFLPVLPEEQASADVKKIYEYVTRRWGFLPNYFQALGHDAQLLQDQVNLYTNAMNEERGLPKIIKEQIATVVSGINMSSYCLPAHLEILGRMGMDKSLSRRLSIDYKSAPLDPNVMELLKFCEKLTTNPVDMRRADIEKLRELGWNDASIFDAVLVTSLYACANRFSSGLGVHDFLKRTSLVRCDAKSLARLGPAAVTLARAEGLEAHARAIAIRLNLP